MIRNCVICGKELTSTQRLYCCSNCKEIAHKENEIKNKEKGKIQRKRKKYEKRQESLNSTIRRANELGISYGKFKALEYIKKVGI